MKIIGETTVGSHIWKMNHKDSDIDIFQIYVEPTKNILNGTAKKKSYFKQIDNTDYAIHEAEKVVNMLLTGNINFIVGVLSPEPNKVTPELLELKEITHNNLAKNCFHSINGMAIHNQMKYEEKGRMTKKKWNQLIRALDFGIRILSGDGVQFKPVKNGHSLLFDAKLLTLLTSYNLSRLPEKPDEKPFRKWLYDLRIKEMNGDI